jgi:transcriptional regulator with XRE-family HTH domain
MTRLNETIIGANIRTWREQMGLTVTELAKQAGLSKSTVSKIETGQVSSPISTLIRIAQVMGTPVAEFFVEPKDDPAYVLTRKGEGAIITRDGSGVGYSYEALAPEMRHKLVEPFILTMQPDDPEGDFQHEGQEFIYMLSGKLAITIAGDEVRLGSGDSLYFDSSLKHTMRVDGNRPARFVDIYVQAKKLRSPSGRRIAKEE